MQAAIAQADAARSPGRDFDGSLTRERLQMFISGIGRAETQFGRDFGTRRRKAGIVYGISDQIQNLFLTCGKFDHRCLPCQMANNYIIRIDRQSSRNCWFYSQPVFLYSIGANASGSCMLSEAMLRWPSSQM